MKPPMQRHLPRLVISAPHSGSGKTTFTMGLLHALRERGLQVQPFKIGPDFIDPSYHTRICGRASRNLDTWMCEDEAVRDIFARAAADADISVIEGVMGLFDGFGPREERGSTAHIAKLLDSPVLLVIDAQRSATSAAAVALGFRDFDPTVNIAGVVFNNVGSEGHYAWLKDVLETRTGLKSCGYLTADKDLRLEERHLGLVPAAERAPAELLQERLLRQFAEHVDLDAILATASRAAAFAAPAETLFVSRPGARVKIGVARDEALNFYYQENLDLLACAGAELVPFSLLHDAALPGGLRGLYLGGGFPEVFAAQLAANSAMRAALRGFHASGGMIYAECGGLMVLCEALVDFEGRRHEMVGLVPATAVMRRDRLSLGYCEVEPVTDTLLARAGMRYRAQTFHYSVLEDMRFEPALKLSHGAKVSYDGYAEPRLFATYVHAHFAACPQLAERFVAQCASLGDQ
jgi:cobyrinic acid a,c-diamide synthase